MTAELDALAWRGDPADIIAATNGDDAAQLLRRWLDRWRPPWHAHAACRDQPLELFYTGRGSAPARALALCEVCPVLAPCRREALADADLDHGIRGGMTAKERTTARRTARTDAA